VPLCVIFTIVDPARKKRGKEGVRDSTSPFDMNKVPLDMSGETHVGTKGLKQIIEVTASRKRTMRKKLSL
jgi:hypothetical protein